MTLPNESNAGFKDEAYPDGTAWRCPVDGCAFSCGDDGPDYCPVTTHGRAPLMRVNRRITFGPLPSQTRDVVVEYRAEP